MAARLAYYETDLPRQIAVAGKAFHAWLVGYSFAVRKTEHDLSRVHWLAQTNSAGQSLAAVAAAVIVLQAPVSIETMQQAVLVRWVPLPVLASSVY